MANVPGIKRGILLFWALWLVIVCLTNVTDGLKALDLLPARWTFASGNYPFMIEVTGIYGLPPWLVAFLFVGAVAWEAIAAALFGRAFILYRRTQAGDFGPIHLAFAVSLALWAAFMLADEIFISYAVEGTHRTIFTAQLVSLLCVRLLPDQ